MDSPISPNTDRDSRRVRIALASFSAPISSCRTLRGESAGRGSLRLIPDPLSPHLSFPPPSDLKLSFSSVGELALSSDCFPPKRLPFATPHDLFVSPVSAAYAVSGDLIEPALPLGVPSSFFFSPLDSLRRGSQKSI